jgi:hypothetical protein
MEVPHDFDDPPPLEVDVSDGRTATSKLAYCPVIERSCGHVDCGNCPALREVLWETMPDFCWVCTECRPLMRHIDPFWADGSCDVCGFESCVLALGQP